MYYTSTASVFGNTELLQERCNVYQNRTRVCFLRLCVIDYDRQH